MGLGGDKGKALITEACGDDGIACADQTVQLRTLKLAEKPDPGQRLCARPVGQRAVPGDEQLGRGVAQQTPRLDDGAQPLELLQPAGKDEAAVALLPRDDRPGGHADGVWLDNKAVFVKGGAQPVEGQQLFAVKLGRGRDPDTAPAAQRPVQPVGRGNHKGLRQTAAVAAVLQCAVQAAAGAILADGAVPQQDAVGAEQPEIVQRLHDRHAAALGGADHGGAEQQERVVDMHGLDPLPPDEVADLAGSAAVPDCVQRQQRFGKAVGSLLIAALIHQHGVAAALKQGALRGKDGVLAAGQPVMTVYQQNFQAAASLGVK